MKKLIISIVILSSWLGVYSQSKIPWTDKNTQSVINNSPFIFEGIVIDTMYYNKCSLTAVKIKINHIYKGDLNPGTIELVDNFGGHWENGIFMHNIIGERDQPMRLGTKAIFFCNKSTYKLSPMITDNDIRVVAIESIFYSPGGWMEGLNKVFHSTKEIDIFLSKYPNITIPKDTTIDK